MLSEMFSEMFSRFARALEWIRQEYFITGIHVNTGKLVTWRKRLVEFEGQFTLANSARDFPLYKRIARDLQIEQ